MARTTIDESANVRGKKLAHLLGWTHAETMGRLYFFWHDSQECELLRCSAIDLAIWMAIDMAEGPAIVSAMVQVGFLEWSFDDIYLIIGNEKHINGIQQRRQANKINGKSGGRPKTSGNNPVALQSETQPVMDIKPSRETQINPAENLSTVQYSSVHKDNTLAKSEHLADSVGYEIPDKKILPLKKPSKKSVGYPEAFEKLYSQYPRKEGKKGGFAAFQRFADDPAFPDRIATSLTNYAKQVKGKEVRFVMKFSTFMNNWEDYESRLDLDKKVSISPILSPNKPLAPLSPEEVEIERLRKEYGLA